MARYIDKYDQFMRAIKKQDTKKPIPVYNDNGDVFKHKCPDCLKEVFNAFQHCPYCGKKLEWRQG